MASDMTGGARVLTALVGALTAALGVMGAAVWFAARTEGRLLSIEVGLEQLRTAKEKLERENREYRASQTSLEEKTELVVRRAHQQAEVARLVYRALAGASLQALFDLALESVRRETGADFADVAEFRPAEAAVTVVATSSEVTVETEPVPVIPGSLVAQVLAADEPVEVDDFREEADRGRITYQSRCGAVCGILAAIPAPRRPFGVLGAYRTRPSRFGAIDGAFLRAMSAALATAIERQRINEARRELELRYEELLDHASDLVLSADAKLRLLYANGAAKTELGMGDQDEPGSYSLRDLLEPSAWPAFTEVHAQVASGVRVGRFGTVIRGGRRVIATITRSSGGGVRAVFRLDSTQEKRPNDSPS